jgi:hypothetical protein
LLAFNHDMLALDLFDKPETCAKLWDRLLHAALLDALQTPAGEFPPTCSEASELLAEMRQARWKPQRTWGEGRCYLAEMPDGRVGCRVAVQYQDLVVSVLGIRSRTRDLQPVG